MRTRREKSSVLTPATARDNALRSLGRREHSAAQLRGKLKARGYDPATAAVAVEGLSESGLQSDARYAELLVRSRVAQGYGPLRIKAELAVGGVSDAEISVALQDAECDWTLLAQQLQQRKFGALPDSMAQRQKQYRYLASRGFTSDQIFRVLKGEIEPE